MELEDNNEKVRSDSFHLKQESKLNLDKLFNIDIKKRINEELDEEIIALEKIFDDEIISKMKKNQFFNKHEELALELKKKISSTKLTIKELKVKPEFFEQIIFLKFIKDFNVLIIASSTKELLIYDMNTNISSIEDFKKDYITCVDYDKESKLFVFGHFFGSISFAAFDNNKLIFSKKKLEGYSNVGIKQINLLFDSQMIIFTNVDEFTEILYKCGKNSTKYQIKHVLSAIKGKKYRLNSFTTFKNTSNVKNKCLTLLMAFTSQVDVIFIKIDLLLEKENIKSIEKPVLLHKIVNTLNEQLFIQKYEEENLNLNFSIKAIMDNKQWLIECQNYVLIIWGRKIEQYFITPDFSFINSFSINLDYLVRGAFLCSTELLCVIDYKYDVFFLRLDKLRYSLDTISDVKSVIENIDDKFNFKNTGSLFISQDNQDCFCFFDNSDFFLFEILDWRSYLKLAKQNSLFREAIVFMINLIKGNSWKLKGVMYPLFNCLTDSENKEVEKKMYYEELISESEKLIKDLEEKVFKNEKLTLGILGISMELLILTNNYQFLSLQFINTIINNHRDNHLVIQNLIEELFLITNDKTINECFNGYMFVKIIELFDNEKNAVIVQQFLIYILKNFKVKEELLNLIKIMTSSKDLAHFSFYFLIQNPNDINNIKEFMNFDKKMVCLKKLKRNYLFVYDMFMEKKMLKSFKTKESLNDSSRLMIKVLFVETFEDYLTHFTIDAIYVLLQICEETFFEKETDDWVLSNFDRNYNDLFKKILKAVKPLPSYYLLIMIFRVNFERRLNEKYLENYFISFLDEENLKSLESLVNFEYLFITIYNFYYLDRKYFMNSKKLNDFLNLNKSKHSIYKILLNDIRGKLVDNFEIYKQTNSLFEIMKRNLKRKDENQNNENFIILLKSKYSEILELDAKKFVELVLLLPIESIIEIIELLDNNPETQYELLLKVEKMNNGEYINGKLGLKYFEYISIYKPEKIVSFLENKRYDIDQILKICENKKTRNERGLGYLKYKMGKTAMALKIYCDYLKSIWMVGKGDKENEELIFTLVDDVIGFKLEINELKEVLLKFVIFISALPKMNSFKKIIIDRIIKKMFSLDYDNVLEEIKTSQKLKFFIENTDLANGLFLNLKIIIDLIYSKDQIFLEKNIEDKIYYIRNFQKGVSTVYRECAICQKTSITNSGPNGVVFHTCKSMFHLNCLSASGIQLQTCPVCEKSKESNLKSFFKKIGNKRDHRPDVQKKKKIHFEDDQQDICFR